MKIFISYKRNVEPDAPVANQVFEALNKDYDVFIDTTMGVGTKWAERIEKEIKSSDFIIPFLSEHSVHSEMVIAEIETAHFHNKETKKTIILPVRLAYSEPFAYPLSAYLNPINWAVWDNEADTQQLIAELLAAVSGGELEVTEKDKEDAVRRKQRVIPVPQASATPIKLEPPEGTMEAQSVFYIQRNCDDVALGAITKQGMTITIKGPRQMGKSSLLNQIISSAVENKKLIAFMDFQMIESSTLNDPDIFYRQFCSWITYELELKDRTEEYWKLPLGNVQRTTNYVQKYILKELGQPLVLAMDEVERVFDSPFRSDFFSMLRSWHNKRSAKSIWKQVDLVLVTSTEPYQFIADLNQSPFNVGEVIDLEDFDGNQVADLNHRHGNPFNDSELKILMEFLSGHPYLTRRGLYLVASSRLSAQNLLDQAIEDKGPFGDHLRNHFYRIQGNKGLVDGLKQIIKQGKCDDENIFFRLRGAGLVKREDTMVIPRNKTYAEYFLRYFND